MAISLSSFLPKFEIEKRNLNSVPVIGWESKNCNANTCRESTYLDKKLDNANKKKVKWFNTASNAGKLLGAFPFITGQIVGLSRIIMTITDDRLLYNESLLNKAKHIVRGLSEIAGIGIIWLALDVLATTGRFFMRIERAGKYAPI